MLFSNLVATITSEVASFFVAIGKKFFGGIILDIAKIIPEKKQILCLNSFIDNGGRV